MGRRTPAYFDELIALAHSRLANIQVVRRDESPSRDILELQGQWGSYLVRIIEIVARDHREYRYYVFAGSHVVAGFDNHADLSAIRLKHGTNWKKHQLEPTPHLHTEGKTKLQLTDEVTLDQFLIWLESNMGANQ
jgi:hypothetical protein